MIITTKISMDLQLHQKTPVVNAVQTDSYCRNLEISLFANRKAVCIPGDAAVIIRYKKADGKGGEYDTMPDGSPAWSAVGNTLTVALAPQVLTFPGNVNLSVSVIHGDIQLNTFPVQLDVQPVAKAPLAGSENYFNVTNFLSAPSNAEPGQYLRVAAVDSSGKVTALEVATLEDGVTPEFSIGTVETLAPDADATASITGTVEKPVLNLGIPSGTEVVPDYWQNALDEGAKSINTALLEAGSDKSAFLFYTDAHWDGGGQKAPALLRYLWRNTGMRKTIFGGDIVSTEGADYDTMAYLWEWRKQIKELPNHHSVVGNHDDGNETNNLFSPEYIYGYLMAAEETGDIVRGSDLFYYIDDTNEKTRYLYLDTGYTGLSTISEEQSAFITEALKSTPSGWHIVVVSHIWYMPDYNQYSVKPIPIVGLSDAAATVCTILDNYNARAGEFADCSAMVAFCIGGHVHIDHVGTTASGIPIILCETASWNVRSAFANTPGTDTETAVSGIIADYTAGKVTVVRVGRGSSFQVDLPTGTMTEIPDDTEEPDVSTYTNVLDTVGYTENRRLSGGDGSERDNEGTDLTGLIPCPPNSTFYLKNVTMPDTSENYYAYVARYDANQTHLGGYHMNSSTDSYCLYDESGNLVRFTLNHDDYAYIRIVAQNIDDTSIITVNEPIE